MDWLDHLFALIFLLIMWHNRNNEDLYIRKLSKFAVWAVVISYALRLWMFIYIGEEYL